MLPAGWTHAHGCPCSVLVRLEDPGREVRAAAALLRAAMECPRALGNAAHVIEVPMTVSMSFSDTVQVSNTFRLE